MPVIIRTRDQMPASNQFVLVNSLLGEVTPKPDYWDRLTDREQRMWLLANNCLPAQIEKLMARLNTDNG